MYNSWKMTIIRHSSRVICYYSVKNCSLLKHTYRQVINYAKLAESPKQNEFTDTLALFFRGAVIHRLDSLDESETLFWKWFFLNRHDIFCTDVLVFSL